jgi:hypothetical protein
MKLDQLALDALRDAVHHNLVSFPSQVPAFPKLARADLQCKMVQLYFVRRWSSESIGNRYGVTRERVRQILVQWKHRALLLGLIQYIPPAEGLAELAAVTECPAMVMHAGASQYALSAPAPGSVAALHT